MMKTTLKPYELTEYDRKFNVYYRSFPMHIKNSGYYIYEYYMSYYALLLIVIGSTCNLTSFFIMMRKPMRKHPCMRYLAMLSITDLLVLYQWNLNTFFKYHLSRAPLHFDLEEISLFLCRWLSYMAFSCLQQSAWLLALVSFDRLMIVYSTIWSHTMNRSSRINAVIGVLILTMFTLNSHILFKNGYIIYNSPPNATAPTTAASSPPVDDQSYLYNFTTNDASYFFKDYSNQRLQKPSLTNKIASVFTDHQTRNYQVACYKSKNDPKYIFPKWEKAHLIIYNAIPFSIMLICNSLIIYNIKFKSKVQSKAHGTSKRKRRMTVMLIIVTFSFMILTLPSVIVHTFFREFLLNKPYRRFVNLIVNNLLHTSHAINFFFYVLSAPNFRNEFIRSLNELKRFYRRKFHLSGEVDSRTRTNASLVSGIRATARPTTQHHHHHHKMPVALQNTSEPKLSENNKKVDARLIKNNCRRETRTKDEEDDEMSSSSSSSTYSQKISRENGDAEFPLTEMVALKTGGALTGSNTETSTNNKPSKASSINKKNSKK